VLAFAAACSPRRSRAPRFLPACENHPLTRVPEARPAEPATDACSAADRHEQEPANAVVGSASRVAAMCDARGPRWWRRNGLLPIADARIDAAPGCGAEAGPMCGPGPERSPLGGPVVALAEHAVLGGFELPAPVLSELAPPSGGRGRRARGRAARDRSPAPVIAAIRWGALAVRGPPGGSTQDSLIRGREGAVPRARRK